MEEKKKWKSCKIKQTKGFFIDFCCCYLDFRCKEAVNDRHLTHISWTDWRPEQSIETAVLIVKHQGNITLDVAKQRFTKELSDNKILKLEENILHNFQKYNWNVLESLERISPPKLDSLDDCRTFLWTPGSTFPNKDFEAWYTDKGFVVPWNGMFSDNRERNLNKTYRREWLDLKGYHSNKGGL